jgi:hypothetical protein
VQDSAAVRGRGRKVFGLGLSGVVRHGVRHGVVLKSTGR